VRKNVFAENNQEPQKGILSIGLPIFSFKGVEEAITLIAESENVSIDVLKMDYAHKFRKIGNQLSKALGYRG
jgi:DNA-binding IclR family transcriptional regulator